MFKFGMLALSAVVLSGCIATAPNPDDNVRAQAWDQIDHITNATVMGDNRLRITASSAPGYGIAELETDLLARAAGEAVRRNAPRFVIVHLSYDDAGLGGVFVPNSYNDGVRGWIGTYEDLVAARTNVDPDGSLARRLRFKDVTAVVRLLAPGEAEDRRAFSADDLYVSLISERIERRDIKPQRYLTLRRR